MRALILITSVLTSLGSAKAEPAIEAYYKGLVAEKVAGERDQAVALYREVVERYLKGDAEYALAARGRERLQRLGAEVIDQTMPRRNQLPLQRLRERFDGRSRRSRALQYRRIIRSRWASLRGLCPAGNPTSTTG